jgi:hypothetical protein
MKGAGKAFVNGGFGGISAITSGCNYPYIPSPGGFGGGAGAGYAAGGEVVL